MAFTEAPKTEADAQKALEGLRPREVQNAKGIQQIIELLKKGEWAAMAGAILGLWTQYFGSPEEKKEAVQVRKEATDEQVEQETSGDLDTLRRQIAAQDKGEVAAEEKRLQSNPELGDGHEYVIIGDSAANGMHLSYSPNKRPAFIGKDGMTTMAVLRKLRENQGVLKGRKKAIIYCGGNNILSTPPEQMRQHMIEMAQICHAAGIPEIIVNTQYPPDPRWAQALGSRYDEFKRRNEELRRLLLDGGQQGLFAQGVRVVDLFTPFADSEGKMKEEYVNLRTPDYLHPWLAYKPALDHMLGGSKAA